MSAKYYDNIDDFPLFNWTRCQQGKLKFTRINTEEGSEEDDVKAWELLLDTFYAEFGLGEQYERVLELKRDIAELQCDLVIEDDNFLKNKIRRKEKELAEILGRKVENDLDTCLIYLGKWVGYPINQKETSVRMFYKLMAEYKAEAERMKKAK